MDGAYIGPNEVYSMYFCDLYLFALHPCRLWDEDDVLEEQVTPELLDADLAPLALTLAAWGSPGGTGLPWLDNPDPDRMKTADELLMDLGAISQTGAVTREG